MVDKLEKGVYVWYSPATDVTGKKLAEALGAKHGKTQPKNGEYDVVLCWGAKMSKDVAMAGSLVLNHVNAIRVNRNKLAALEVMAEGDVAVAPFVTAENYKNIGKGLKPKIKLPVIGRTKYHQGGKGFWECPTMERVEAAINAGAGYFQTLITIADEFRLHVIDEAVVYAVKKVPRSIEEMEEAYIRQELKVQQNLAEKNGDPFDEATAKLVLRRQAKKFAANGPDMSIRSNKRGWKFARAKQVDPGLAAEAAKAVKALGLDFGAVDCCIDTNGKPHIIEVNTGPGLEETPFKAYVAAFKEKLAMVAEAQKPAKKAAPKKTAAVLKADTVGKLTQAASQVDLVTMPLKERLAVMSQMAENVADKEEEEVLSRVFNRMFGE
jgi:glutathione synthase/RimK-type ligase-like ATP-grasp enzyme